ncbi:TEA domain-containing protein [Phanerochaete sordida]|uniref:TEA domain-containing protein n=1 Tax=Phanerochaete sordida TaxID=48140 RepID=A0A9P3GFK8_9APHY|nr:TEA domain-containing protein [Phanerochaete sordida]
MGLDRSSRRARAQRTPSSTTPSPATRSKPLAIEKCMADARQAKSLTPHRKHHKLLKDGSEVWSEDVEKVFVQGLREYWESPWATYSRGRSRWRNQFLVEHLKKNGIERSKKQVASHIQVLRNMWRGEPEFHLVAGGEELFAENGLLASPKHKAGSESRDSLPSPEAMPSSPSSTPDYMMPEFMTRAASSSGAYAHDRSPAAALGSLDGGRAFDGYPGVSRSIAVAQGTPPPSPPSDDRIKGAVKLEPLLMGGGPYALPQSPLSGYMNVSADASPIYPMMQPPTQFLTLALWAEGMPMFSAAVDHIIQGMAIPPATLHDSPSTVMLRIKISIPSADDIYTFPNLHGFHGAVTLSSHWHTQARCSTTVYAGRTCVSQEVGILDSLPAAHVHHALGHAPPAVTFNLPDSSLSRCKWLRDGPDLIVQQLAVDGVVLAVLLFHLERTPAGTGPAAELMGFQKRRATPAGRPPSQSFPSPPLAHAAPPPAGHRAPAAGFLAGSPSYTFPPVPPLPLPQGPGDMGGPRAGGSGAHGGLDGGSAGLLGADSSPGRMYYPQS